MMLFYNFILQVEKVCDNFGLRIMYKKAGKEFVELPGSRSSTTTSQTLRSIVGQSAIILKSGTYEIKFQYYVSNFVDKYKFQLKPSSLMHTANLEVVSMLAGEDFE